MVFRSNIILDALWKNTLEGKVTNGIKIKSIEPIDIVPFTAQSDCEYNKSNPKHATIIRKTENKLGIVV